MMYGLGLDEVDVGVHFAIILAKTCGIDQLQDVECLLKDVLNVVLVGEADDGEELGERDRTLVIREPCVD